MVIYIKNNKLIFIIFLIITSRILYLCLYKKDDYSKLLDEKTKYYTYGLSSPRGRILDINGNVLVDNIKKRVIVYEKNKNISNKQEFIIAKKLSNYLNNNNYRLSDTDKANYIFNKENNIEKYLSKDDYNKLLNGIITYSDAKKIAINHIIKNDINNLSNDILKEIYIYTLMNKDYSYDKKIIFKDISDNVYFKILNENIPGISGEYLYERVYPYGYKSIYGSVGKIDETDLKDFLNKGYFISDIVGKSYLEKEYENILKGGKAKYKLEKDGTLKLVEKEIKGEDITLNIDININNQADEILKKYITETKGKVNTEYYNGSYLIIGKPTGEIVSVSAFKLDKNNNLIETSKDIVNSSFTVGSVVKAASNTVGYKENVINKGKKINDSCVKLYMNTEKCSYKRLGLVDDVTAIEKSSNYYQYINALKVMGYNNYSYNMKVKAKKEDFDKYRNIYMQYGLGDKTYIDLPSESTGIKGSITAPDLLLNLSIGQYDSYTPVQLLSYINTLATHGKRYNLSIKNKEMSIVKEVDITPENISRINNALNSVVTKGTGRGYIYKNDGAGKTGTSETLIDIDNDGLYETKTITTSFVGYYPYNEPKYTFIIISPNISSNKHQNNYKVPINRYIIHDLTKILFENT